MVNARIACQIRVAFSSRRTSTRPSIAVQYAKIRWKGTMCIQLGGAAPIARRIHATLRSRGRSKMTRNARKVIEGWMAARPGCGTECLFSLPFTGDLRTRTVYACCSNTQLCGQAPDKIRVELSDGGCINVESVGVLRRCVGDTKD